MFLLRISASFGKLWEIVVTIGTIPELNPSIWNSLLMANNIQTEKSSVVLIFPENEKACVELCYLKVYKKPCDQPQA